MMDHNFVMLRDNKMVYNFDLIKIVFLKKAEAIKGTPYRVL